MLPEGGKLLPGVSAGLAARISQFASVRYFEPLARHTTFKVGGPAAVFALPKSPAALREVVGLCRKEGVRHFVLGGGSNVLFPDSGFPGVVISTARLDGIAIDGEHVTAAAGARISELITLLHHQGTRSLDFLAGIPGTIGGAVAMNAGITGAQIGERVESVWAIDSGGEVVRFTRDECRFAYRESRFKVERSPILAVRFSLGGADYDASALLARRVARQPSAPSAGCIFRNPPGDAAGRLIDVAGLKGLRVGMAKVSEKHANFIVNLGGATSADIRKIIDIVRQKVYKSFRILLELEIEVIDG